LDGGQPNGDRHAQANRLVGILDTDAQPVDKLGAQLRVSTVFGVNSAAGETHPIRPRYVLPTPSAASVTSLPGATRGSSGSGAKLRTHTSSSSAIE
jgi:hypothetical protein